MERLNKAYITAYPYEAGQCDLFYVMVDTHCIGAYGKRKDAELKAFNYNTYYKFASKDIKNEKQVTNSLRKSKNNSVNFIG